MNVNILSMDMQFSPLFVRKRIIFCCWEYKKCDKRATRTGLLKTASVTRPSPARPSLFILTLTRGATFHSLSSSLLPFLHFFTFSLPLSLLPSFLWQVSFGDLSSSHHQPAVSHRSPGGAPPSPPTIVPHHPR